MFLIGRTGWTKNGIYKGQTLVQWGGGVEPSVTGLAWGFSEIFVDDNVYNRKRSTYLKRFFKTSSKLRIIKLLVNLQSTPPHLPVNH